MKPIYKAWLMQIDVCNVCHIRRCPYCTRYLRHLRRDHQYFMDLGYFDKILSALKNWPNMIGIIGGEPTLHPQFQELLEVMRSHFPPEKFELWTSHKENYAKFKKEISRSAKYLAYNEHNDSQIDLSRHQPTTIAIEEVVEDEDLRKKLIEDCWIQKRWCPNINPKGGFFCEVAGSLDLLLDGPGGYDATDSDWWKKNPSDFVDQVERYCGKCGMALPIHTELVSTKKEKITPELLKEFKSKNLRSTSNDDVELFDKKLEKKDFPKDWEPWENREFKLFKK